MFKYRVNFDKLTGNGLCFDNNNELVEKNIFEFLYDISFDYIQNHNITCKRLQNIYFKSCFKNKNFDIFVYKNHIAIDNGKDYLVYNLKLVYQYKTCFNGLQNLNCDFNF